MVEEVLMVEVAEEAHLIAVGHLLALVLRTLIVKME